MRVRCKKVKIPKEFNCYFLSAAAVPAHNYGKGYHGERVFLISFVIKGMSFNSPANSAGEMLDKLAGSNIFRLSRVRRSQKWTIEVQTIYFKIKRSM